MTIQSIIRQTIKRLELEGKLMTPDFYAEAFCKEATKARMNVDDCKQVEKFSKTLNKDFQKDLKNFRIKTMSDLARFLISKLNRTNPTQCSDTLEAQNILTKRILQVVSVLHNEEASALAQRSIELIDSGASPLELDNFRQLWVNFITTYDDTFLQKLKAFGDVDTQNLQKTVANLHVNAQTDTENIDNSELRKIASVLVASLVPSIASSVNDKIANLSTKIRKDPSILGSLTVDKEIKEAIKLRIMLDKKAVKQMVESLDGILDKLSLRLIDMIEKSDNSNSQIQAIKKELESFGVESSSNFKLAHKKLFTIATALEENTEVLSTDLKVQSDEVSVLVQRVGELEEELKTARQESKIDFLTKMYNRRALDEYLDIKEAEYKRHGRNFAIIMFDLDHFKNVNDTYGHEAGDAVLSAFSKIIKQQCRTEDIVGRYGGEEFLAVLGDTDTAGGVAFAEKVRKHVENAKFMYKNKRIVVTVSSGVSDRKRHVSATATIKSADEYLYSAKKGGRNRVGYKK